MTHLFHSLWSYISGFFAWIAASYSLLWRSWWWGKLLIVIFWTLLSIFVAFYGVSRWYVASTRDQPLQLGVTYVADYAAALGVDPRETYDAILHDLDVKHLRLVSYWSKHEPEQGQYDFSELDWQFAEAEEAGAKISLALGLRQPRWPECHAPQWADVHNSDGWQDSLDAYIETVVNRYKDSPALESYQLENEYFLSAFGECPTPSRERLQTEFDLVKRLDPERPIIMTRSDNLPGLLLSEPRPDIVGMSVYRRVWNENIYRGYFNYPLPSWYYAGLAGLQKIFTGRDSMLHEMQMEPWPPSGQFVADVSREVQDESMNASDFENRVQFAERTGLRTIDLWGAVWWYYRKAALHDDSVWNAAKASFDKRRQ